MIVVDREDGRYAYVKVSDTTYAEFRVEDGKLTYVGSAVYSDGGSSGGGGGRTVYKAPDISRRDSGETIYWSGGKKVAGVTKDGTPVVYIDPNQPQINLQNPLSNSDTGGLIVKYTLPNGEVVSLREGEQLKVVYDIIPQSNEQPVDENESVERVERMVYEVGYTKADEDTLKRMYVDAYRYMQGYKVVGSSFMKDIPLLRDVGVSFIGNLALIREGIEKGRGDYVFEGTVGAGMDFVNVYVFSNVAAITTRAGSSLIKVGVDVAKEQGVKMGLIQGVKSANQVIQRGVDEYNIAKTLFKPETTHLQIGKTAIPIQRVYEVGGVVTYGSMVGASVKGVTPKAASDVVADVAVEQGLYRLSKVVPQVRAVSVGFVGAPLEEFSQEKVDNLLEKPILGKAKRTPISLSLPKQNYGDYVEIKGDGVKGFITPLGIGVYNLNIVERERIVDQGGERTFIRGVGVTNVGDSVGVGFLRGEIVKSDSGEFISGMQGNLYLDGVYVGSMGVDRISTFPATEKQGGGFNIKTSNPSNFTLDTTSISGGDGVSGGGSIKGIVTSSIATSSLTTIQKTSPKSLSLSIPSSSTFNIAKAIELPMLKSGLISGVYMNKSGVTKSMEIQKQGVVFSSSYILKQNSFSGVQSVYRSSGRGILDTNGVLGKFSGGIESKLILSKKNLLGMNVRIRKGWGERLFTKDRIKLW